MKSRYKDTFIWENYVRICRGCEKEFGINQRTIFDQGWEITHGLCNRHAVIALKSAGISDDHILAHMQKVRKEEIACGKLPTRDLRLPDSEPLIQWLKSPPKYGI